MNLPETFENNLIGKSINLISDSDFPAQYPLHWHKYIEIVSNPDPNSTEKPAVMEVDQQEYTLNPGDLLIIWPGELHNIVSNPDRQLRGVQFAASILYEMADFAPYIQHMKMVHQISFNEYPEILQNLQLHLLQMEQLELRKAPFTDVEKLILLLEFFMTLASFTRDRFAGQVVRTSPYPEDTLKKIQDACKYLSDNCEKNISLTTMADLAGFSPAYFSRIFKQITSISFVEYLTLQRIKTAQVLLSDFGIPITEIAFKCGFSSISTFNRVFRQHLGCSPTEYRKLYDAK